MSKIRTFIAVDLAGEVRARAAALIKRLSASGAKVSWTKPENMHVTLKFLGDTADAKLPEVCRAVESAVQGMPPFRIRCAGAGAFPRIARPRTLWLGLDAGTQEMQQLQAGIEQSLYDAGFPRERRRFVPHLTLGRVREGGASQEALSALLEENADFLAGETEVDEVVTYGSFLDPSGPTYQVLGHAELA